MSEEKAPSLPSTMLASVEKLLISSAARLHGPTSSSIHDMVVHHMGWGSDAPATGKRLRPLLMLLFYRGYRKDWDKVLPAACALEWLHNFSLIHDDIQDQSTMRRGREAVWKRWGIAQAINTGDALYALAHLTYQQLPENAVPPEAILAAGAILNEACLRLTQGQHRDLVFETQDVVSNRQYLEMITLKTSALFSAAAAVGAVLAGAGQRRVSSSSDFGHHIGLAFQIQDDLLGIWGAPDQTGKITGDDLKAKKKTLPIIYALEHSQRFAQWWASSLTPDVDIERQARELEELGARRYAQNLAADHTQQALQALEIARLDEPARGEIEYLTSSLLQRQG